MPRLRVTVWGPGYFGRKWMQEIARSPDAELAGVISRSPDRAASLQQELGLERLEAFADAAAAKAAGTDAVIIATPQALHCAAAVAALDAGLHVLIEKPLAVSLDEARAIVEAARAHTDRVCMVTQNFRWRPHTLALRTAVKDGLIGKIGHIGLACRQAIKRGTTDAWRERMDEPYLGDFAIHHFDLLRYVSGLEVEDVFATSFRPQGSWYDGRSAAAAILKMSGGTVASYNGTIVSSGLPTPQEGLITLVGETGVLHLDSRYRVTLSGVGDTIVLPEPPVPEGELGYGLRALADAVRRGSRPETHVEDNFKSFAILAAALESSASGQSVKVARLS